MGGRVQKRFRRPVEREVQRSPIFNAVCMSVGLVLGLLLIVGAFGVMYDSLFVTHIDVYEDNDMMEKIPSNLEFIDFPIEYKPNSEIMISASATSVTNNGYKCTDTIKTDSEGKAIYRYKMPNSDEIIGDITIGFEPSDNKEDIKLIRIFTEDNQYSQSINNATVTIYDSNNAYDTNSYQDINTRLY